MPRETGTVKWFSVEKGYGFIEREDGGDLFAHRTAIADPEIRKLEAGQRVEFREERSAKGPKAADIRVLGAGGEARPPEDSRAPGGSKGQGRKEPELMTLDEQLERALGERVLRLR